MVDIFAQCKVSFFHRWKNLLIVMFIASVILGISAIIGISIEVHDRIEKGRYNESSLQKELDLNNCVFKSKVETGKEIYCGKACWRKEKRTEYTCETGIKVVIE